MTELVDVVAAVREGFTEWQNSATAAVEHLSRTGENLLVALEALALGTPPAEVATEEVWRPVPGFEKSHEISDRGAIRSVSRTVEIQQQDGSTAQRPVKGRMLKPQLRGNSSYVTLSKNGKPYVFPVRRLVATAFPAKKESAAGSRPRRITVSRRDVAGRR